MTPVHGRSSFFGPAVHGGFSAAHRLELRIYRYARSRAFHRQQPIKRDKVNLDIFWLKDESLEDSDDLPDPDVLAQEIVDDLQTALEQFSAVPEG